MSGAALITSAAELLSELWAPLVFTPSPFMQHCTINTRHSRKLTSNFLEWPWEQRNKICRESSHLGPWLLLENTCWCCMFCRSVREVRFQCPGCGLQDIAECFRCLCNIGTSSELRHHRNSQKWSALTLLESDPRAEPFGWRYLQPVGKASWTIICTFAHVPLKRQPDLKLILPQPTDRVQRVQL